MLDKLLKFKTNKLIYIFYSPWILFFVCPITPFYGNIDMILILVFFIFWVQMSFYFLFTLFIGRRLISIEWNTFFKLNKLRFSLHTMIDYLLFTLILFVNITEILDLNTFYMIFIYTLSELFRNVLIAKLIVVLEEKKNIRLKDYMLTLCLVLNPQIGAWSLHTRILLILEDKITKVYRKSI